MTEEEQTWELFVGQRLPAKKLGGYVLIYRRREDGDFGQWSENLLSRCDSGTIFEFQWPDVLDVVDILGAQLKSGTPKIQLEAAKMVLDIIGPEEVLRVVADGLPPKDS